MSSGIEAGADLLMILRRLGALDVTLSMPAACAGTAARARLGVAFLTDFRVDTDSMVLLSLSCWKCARIVREMQLARCRLKPNGPVVSCAAPPVPGELVAAGDCSLAVLPCGGVVGAGSNLGADLSSAEAQ